MSVNVHGVRQAQPRYQALIDDPDTPEDVREEAKQKLDKITDSLKYYAFLELLVDKFQSGELFDMLLDEEGRTK